MIAGPPVQRYALREETDMGTRLFVLLFTVACVVIVFVQQLQGG